MKYIITTFSLLSLTVLAGCQSNPASVNANAGITETQNENENTEVVVVNNNEDEKSGETILEETELSQEVIDWMEDYDVDAALGTLEIVNRVFAKDDLNVYYKYFSLDQNKDQIKEIRVVDGAEPSSFISLSNSSDYIYQFLSRDNDSIFAQVDGVVVKLNVIDPNSFELVENADEFALLGEDNDYYLFAVNHGVLPIKKNDFEKFDNIYMTDGKNLYYRSYEVYVPIENINVGSLEMLEHSYFHDKYKVYGKQAHYENISINELVGAEVGDFDVLSSWIGKDSKYIFNNTQRIDDSRIDLATFKVFNSEIENNMYLDKNALYIFIFNSYSRFEDFDLPTLEVINQDYWGNKLFWKDKNGVYTTVLESLHEVTGKYEIDYAKVGVDANSFGNVEEVKCEEYAQIFDCDTTNNIVVYEDKEGKYGYPTSGKTTSKAGYIKQYLIKTKNQ